MKKILFALVTAVALMCSVTNKASAAEENGEEPTATSSSYNDNLYTGMSFCYDYETNEVTNGQKNHTNFIKLQDGKDIFIAVKYSLPYSDVDLEYNVTDFDCTLYTKDFVELTISEFTYVNFSLTLDSSGENMLVYYLIKYDDLKTATDYNQVKYISYNPRLVYTSITNGDVVADGSDVEDMYISFVEPGSVDIYSNLEIDFTPKTNTISWRSDLVDINSNFLNIKVAKDMSIYDLKQHVTAKSLGRTISYNCYNLNENGYLEEGNSYLYAFEATDSTTGEYDILLVLFDVVDAEAPKIAGAKEYTVPNKIQLSINSIKNALSVQDNFDDPENIDIRVKYDYYSENYDKPGEYYVCFTATDSSNNSSDYIVKIIVEDKDIPVFYDKNGMVKKGPSKIYKSTDSVLLLSDIIENLKATDEVDGDLTIEISSDQYTGNGDKEGVYTVVLKATDSSKNVAYHRVNIVVSESMPTKTILLDDDGIVIVERSVRLTNNDFFNMLKLKGVFGNTTVSYFTADLTYYNSYASTTGEYLVDYSIASTNGTSLESTFTVRVVEARVNSSLVNTPEPEEAVIVKILKWIWNFLVSIFDWFMGLFK